jgi:hypothetical protein
MLRLPFILVSAIAGVTIVAGSAYALPKGPGGGSQKVETRPVGLLAVLRLPGVQRELKLSLEQQKQIYDLGALEALFKHFGGGGGPIASAPINEELKKPEGPPILPGSKRELKRITEILKAAQMVRLKQIELQSLGAAALKKPEVIAALDLSLDQREKLNSLVKQADKQLGNNDAPPSGNDLALLSGVKPDQVEKELMEKSLKVLSPEQRQKFESMKGKQMDFHRKAPSFIGPSDAQNAPAILVPRQN